MSKRTSCVVLVAALAVFLLGCNLTSGTNNQSGYPGGPSAYSHVYIAGATGTSNTSMTPCFWKDAAWYSLSMGTGNSVGGAWGLAVDGSGNLYFVGGVGTSNSSGVPCYWKNGSLNTLPMGTGNSVGIAGGAAFDSSGNLYITGATGASMSSLAPCYWKAGTRTPLALGTGNVFGAADGIAIDSTGNLDISGRVGPSSSSVSRSYWKGGTVTVLSNSDVSDTFCGGLVLDSSGNVYATGGTGSSPITPVYFLNGSPNSLPMGLGNSSGLTNGAFVDSSGNLLFARLGRIYVGRVLEERVADHSFSGSSRRWGRRIWDYHGQLW
jgi:hypothetical protein